MSKRHKNNIANKKIGAAPGTLFYLGRQTEGDIKISVIDYNIERFKVLKDATLEDCSVSHQPDSITWINVDGVHQVEKITLIGEKLKIHPLILEDIVNTIQRPKLDDFENILFLASKMLRFNAQTQKVEQEHVSFVLSKNYIITFQENISGDDFAPIRERLSLDTSKFRKSGTDYLLYALLDSIVDHYFVVLDQIGELIELQEEELNNKSTPYGLKNIFRLKRELNVVRRLILPMREILSNLARNDHELINENSKLYFRDVCDHVIQNIDILDQSRDNLVSITELYLSSLSYKMNSVMKLLTIISTIFMPLTFLTSVYGMNFVHMPELQWKYGYLVIWAIIVVIAFLMISWFKRLRWF